MTDVVLKAHFGAARAEDKQHEDDDVHDDTFYQLIPDSFQRLRPLVTLVTHPGKKPPSYDYRFSTMEMTMRKLSAKETEIMLLREKLQVCKNLLRDVAENEVASRHPRAGMNEPLVNCVLRDQLCAEIGMLLYQEDHAIITVIG